MRAESVIEFLAVKNMESTKEDLVEKFADLVQSEIRYCPNDQPIEEDEVVWIFGKSVDLDDLFIDMEVPEDLWEEVSSYLSCPNCHSDIRRPTDVGVRFEHEIEHDLRVQESMDKYSGELIEFSFFLREYPYLGATHRVGKAIIEEINEFPSHEIVNEDWYRARRFQGGKKFSSKNMFPSDPNKYHIPEGRYNHVGQAYWYLANTKEAAAAETVKKDESMVWVQTFHIEQLTDLLDVRPWEADDDRAWTPEGVMKKISLVAVALVFSDQLVQWADRDATLKPEYNVPRFVADAAKHAGMTGIIFKSTKHYDTNIVVFDRKTPFVPIGEPEHFILPDHLARLDQGLFYVEGFPVFFGEGLFNRKKIQPAMRISKVISRGQIGADQAALDAAIELGIPHGGWIPKGRKTEIGLLPEKYKLKEMPTSASLAGTEKNIFDSDGTLIVSHGKLTGGPALTRKLAKKYGRPWVHIDMEKIPLSGAALAARSWIQYYGIKVLNVAGARASKDTRIYTVTKRILKRTLAEGKEDFSITRFESARQRYKPDDVRYLLITEAPPREETDRFFYYEDVYSLDGLFLETMKVLYPNQYKDTKTVRESKRKFLNCFKHDGFYLVDSVPIPLKDTRPSAKRQVIAAFLPWLCGVVREIANERTKIILISAPVYKICHDPLKSERFNVINEEMIDFPVSGGQKEYRRKLGSLLKKYGWRPDGKCKSPID